MKNGTAVSKWKNTTHNRICFICFSEEHFFCKLNRQILEKFSEVQYFPSQDWRQISTESLN